METLNSGTNSFLLKVNLISKETKNIHGLIVRLLRLYNIAEERSLLFSLMKKVTKKSLPENKKLKNYLKVPFRSPSRSSFVLNSRTAATLLSRCFLCFLFKGGEKMGYMNVYWNYYYYYYYYYYF